MPTLFEVFGFRCFFFSDEHMPIHIHVEKGGCRAKIALTESIVVVSNQGFSPAEMKKIIKIIESRKDEVIARWHEYFDSNEKDC